MNHKYHPVLLLTYSNQPLIQPNNPQLKQLAREAFTLAVQDLVGLLNAALAEAGTMQGDGVGTLSLLSIPAPTLSNNVRSMVYSSTACGSLCWVGRCMYTYVNIHPFFFQSLTFGPTTHKQPTNHSWGASATWPRRSASSTP